MKMKMEMEMEMEMEMKHSISKPLLNETVKL